MGPVWAAIGYKDLLYCFHCASETLIAFGVPLTAKIIGLVIVIIVLALTACLRCV